MVNGHSLRMSPALLVLPAGPSPLHPTPARGWCVEGQGCGYPARVLSPPHLSLAVRGVPVTRRVLWLPSRCSLFPSWPSSPSGASVGRSRGVAMPFPGRCVHAPCFVVRSSRCSWSAPGFDSQRCPFLSRWRRLPFPVAHPVLGLAGCRRVSSSRGEKERGREGGR